MRRVAWLRIRIFLKPEDHRLEESLLQPIQTSIPLHGEEARKQGVQYEQHVKEGFEGKKIKTYEILITKEKPAVKLLTHILTRLAPREKERLERNLAKHVDEHGRLYLRLDLEGFADGRALIIHEGRCVHITAQLISHPKTREGLLSTARAILNEVTKA